MPHSGNLRRHARLASLSVIAGLLIGLACWALLGALFLVTRYREQHGNIVWFLPLAGFAVALAYQQFGGRAARGSRLLLEEVHEPAAWVPRRMAPMVAAATVISHIFGASVGREGTALQMSGSLTDLVSRTFRLEREDRRVMLIAALGGGFGAVFGVPWAGMVFGLEVQAVRRIHLRGIVRWTRDHLEDRPAPVPERDRLRGLGPDAPLGRLLAAVVPVAITAHLGHLVVTVLGHPQELAPDFDAAFTSVLFIRSLAIGLACGAAAVVFVGAVDWIRENLAERLPWSPWHPVLGGLATIGLMGMFGREYLGLSTPLIDEAFSGDITSFDTAALKLLFTVVCLGTGFIGGEVTPQFVIGSALGAAVASILGYDPSIGAMLGFAAMFAGAANAPIACTVLAMETFGADLALPAFVACAASYLVSGRQGMYPAQLVTDRGRVTRVGDLPPMTIRRRRPLPTAQPDPAPEPTPEP